MRARTGISSRKAQIRTFPHLSKKPCSQRVFSLDGVLRYSCFSSPVSLIYYIYYYARCQLVAHTSYASFLTSQSSQATIACLLLAYSFSPKVRKYLLGSPAPKKSEFLMFNFPKTARIASHNFAFEITLSQAITLTLLLVCAFSPRVHSIPRGPLPIKSQNFDEIVFFSAGSEKSSVLWRTRFFGFRRKSKISQNYDFLICLAKTFPIFPKSCIIVNPYFS